MKIGDRAVSMIRRESDGPALVLIHGAGANAKVWEPVMRELTSFDVVAPNLPGREGSEGPPLESAEDAAAWIDALLGELGGRAIVLGHSWGGGIALELARASERLTGVVLVSSGARLRVHPTILQAAENATHGGDPVSGRFAFLGSAPREAIDAYDLAARSTPPIATLADWRGCDAFDRLGQLESVSVPVLVAGGADDVLTPPKYQRALVEQLRRAQLALIEGAGHMLPWEKPRELATAIRAWAAAI